MFRPFVLALLLIGCVVWAPPIRAAGPAGTESCWVLSQTTLEQGPLTLYINDTGVRLESIKSQGVILAHAPEWRVMLFNTRDKISYSMSLLEWWKLGVSVVPEARHPYSPKWLDRTKFLGLDCIRLTLPLFGSTRDGTHASGWLSFGTSSGIERKSASKPQSMTLCYYFADKVPPIKGKALKVVQAIYKCPLVDGLPVRIDWKAKGQKKAECSFDTSSCKQAMVPKSLFAYPTGYKKARTAEHALGGDAADDLVKDMLGE